LNYFASFSNRFYFKRSFACLARYFRIAFAVFFVLLGLQFKNIAISSKFISLNSQKVVSSSQGPYYSYLSCIIDFSGGFSIYSIAVCSVDDAKVSGDLSDSKFRIFLAKSSPLSACTISSSFKVIRSNSLLI
jgi:hypothetical protein